VNPAQNGPSWAAMGLDQAVPGGSDPRPEPGAGLRRLPRPRPPADELGDVTEVRLVADHETGGLYVLVFGSSPAIPMLSWPVPRQFVDELLVDGSDAMIRCRPGYRNGSLVTPPGVLPSFFAPRLVPAPARVCGCDDDGCGGDCAGSRATG
jgi:hypothetical protein